MSLNAQALQALLVQKCRTLSNQITDSYIPDFIAGMSDTISEYLTSNLELTVTWIAYTTSTPPVPDPMVTFQAKVSKVNLGLTRSLVQGMTDSSLVQATLNAAYKAAVGSITIDSNQLTMAGPVTLTPLPLFTLSTKASIKFGDSSNSGSDAFEKNMGVLADSVVQGLIGPTMIPGLSGSHLSYTSTATSSIIGVS